MGVIALVFCLHQLYLSLCIVGLPRQLSGKESAELKEMQVWPLGWEETLEEKPTQYSCQDNPKDRGAWWATIYGVTKSRTWLNNWTLYIVIFFKL